MSNPPNAANNKDWKELLLEGSLSGAYNGIKMGWDTTSTLAAPIYACGHKLWQKIGGPESRAENYWKSRSPKTKSTAKKIVCAATWLGAGATGFLAGYNFLALPGIVTGGAITAFPVVGLGTAGYRWIKHKTPLIDALKQGAGAGVVASIGTFLLATPAVVGGTLAGLTSGNIAASATAMALNPDLTVMVQIPLQDHREDKGLLELCTLNNQEKPSTAKLESTLDELSGKICDFRSKHPEDVFWQDPLNKVIETISQPRLEEDGFTPKLSILLTIQRALEALPKNLSNAQKIETVTRILANENFNINPAYLNSSLIDKIEAIPFDSKEYIDAKIKTDAQVDLLVKRGSIMAIVYGIHLKFLKNADNEQTFQTMLEIVQEASKPGANLWDVYELHLGNKLGFFKKLGARLLFWLGHDLHIASYILDNFLKNAISAFRSTVEPKNKDKLNSVFKQVFDQFSQFLERYNGAVDQYIRASGTAEGVSGNLSVYQKIVIDKEGNGQIYRKVKAQYDLKPGGDFGKMMMKELCESFSYILIDRCLPKIKIWGKAKKLFFVGYVVRLVAYTIEFFTNNLLNWGVRKYLPAGIQSLVETGLEKTSPTQYRFQIAIADALKKLVAVFAKDLKKTSTKKPHRTIESSIIDGTAGRLLQILKLKKLKENPTRQQVIQHKNDMTNPQDPKTDKLLEELFADGSKEFMHYYTEKPEQMEGLFGDIITITNDIFTPTTNHPTKKECDAAFEALKKDSKKLAKNAIKLVIKKKGIGPVTNELLDQYMHGQKDANGQVIERGIYEIQKTKGTEIFEQLTTLSQSMSDTLAVGNTADGATLLKNLDQYAETLKKFVFGAQAMDIDLYSRPVQHAFYRAFHSTYEQSIPLAEQVIELQNPKLKYDKLMNVTKLLAEFEPMLNQTPDILRKKLEKIEFNGNRYNHVLPNENHQIPGLDERLRILNDHVYGLEVAVNAAEKERLIIEKLATLGNPNDLANQLKNDPRTWNEKVRNAIPLEDEEAVFIHIRELQAGGNIDAIQIKIENELIAIKNKYTDRKVEFLAQKEATIIAIREKTQESLLEYEQIRNQEFLRIQRKLMTLNENTKKVLENIKASTVPSITVLLSDLPEHPVDDLYKLAETTINTELDSYLDVVFNLVVDPHFYEGTTRLVMGNIITKHTETPEEKATRERHLAELDPDEDQSLCPC